MEEERKIEELQRLIDTHENIVFFGGAGVSTESGIPGFCFPERGWPLSSEV